MHFPRSIIAAKPRGYSTSNRHIQTHERAQTVVVMRNGTLNPFDLRNSHLTSPVIQSVDDPTVPGQPMIRVVRNKFPVLCEPLESLDDCQATPPTMRSTPAAGWQEVVIQHWKYNTCEALMERKEVQLLWQVLKERVIAGVQRPHTRYVQVIENHGPRSGGSLPHPHSQVLCLPFVPPDQANRLSIAARYYAEHGSCVLDDMAAEARRHKRVLVENDFCVAFVPFQLERHHEMWIMSKSSPNMQQEPHIHAVASALHDCLKMLYLAKDDIDYNLIVRQSAVDAGLDSARYKWHVCVIPHIRTSNWAGIKAYGDLVPIRGSPEQHAEDLLLCRDADMPNPRGPKPRVNYTLMAAICACAAIATFAVVSRL